MEGVSAFNSFVYFSSKAVSEEISQDRVTETS